MAAVEEAQDDQLAVTVLEDVRVPNLAAVELPLAVKPTDSGKDAALALVGGIEELSKVTADEERALKLHMRPKDPLCRPLVARRNESNTASFVFKVKRRRLRPQSDDLDGGEDAESWRAESRWSIAAVEVVGAVHTSFTFRTLADAQFLSCRPRDVAAEECVEDHIEAAAERTEPMELVPASFLPPFPRVSQQSREEKILRREKKYHDTVKLQKGGLLVYHRFGEGVKHRTKDGDTLIKEAKAVKHLEVKLNERWGTGRLRGRHNRPSRFRKGVSGHNEVREQQLLLANKITAVFEKRPMYFMKELKDILQEQPKWVLRDVVPAVAYYYCNGPWRSRWVRFGYRPEDYPEARFEQIMEFRLLPAQLRVWADVLGRTKAAAAAAAAATTTTARETSVSTTSSAPTPSSSSSSTALVANTAASKEGGSGTGSDIGGGSGDKAQPTSKKSGTGPGSDGAATAAAAPPAAAGSGASSASPSPSVIIAATPAAAAAASADADGAGAKEAKGGDKEGEVQGEGRKASPGKGGAEPSSAPRNIVGGVVPEISLSNTTKGRFASQVVLNGTTLTARNRHVVGESPIRAVQELALKAPRLDRPGIMTGWWQNSTIEKMRLITLEGIEALVKHKRMQENVSTSANSGGSGGGGDVVLANPLRANMTREEFEEEMEDIASNVEVVEAPAVPSEEEDYDDDDEDGDEEFEGHGGVTAGVRKSATSGGSWKARQAISAAALAKGGVKRKTFAGSGGRSGTGRVPKKPVRGTAQRPASSAAVGVAGVKSADSSAAADGGRGGGGGAGVGAASMREADREVVRSGGESFDETESDSVNSSDLVDDTEDSWDSQADDSSEEDEEEEEEDDEESGLSDGGGGETDAKEEQKRAGAPRSRAPPSRTRGRGRGRGGGAGGGREKAAATPKVKRGGGRGGARGRRS